MAKLNFWAFNLLFLLCCSITVKSQIQTKDSLLQKVTLQNAIEYALAHQPVIQRRLVDEQITQAQIKMRLSERYPQLNFNYNFQHNFLLPTSVIGGNLIKLGQNNTSSGLFTASQYLFNANLLLANRTKADVLLQARQATAIDKIDLAVNVSKAWYDILSTSQQIKVSAENITRIERSLQDAYNQFKAGITDKTDYKRASITLNNTRATLRGNQESLKAKKELLKALMNYPERDTLNIIYDTLQMEADIILDTVQKTDYKTRIEYRILETQSRLLKANLRYNKLSYLPTVSVNGAYNFNYQNNDFVKLYGTSYPASYAGLTFGVPLFQGGRRRALIREAELNLTRNELDIARLRNDVNAGYAQAMASYKSNLNNYIALKENASLAQEVYDVIQLQYRSGIKTYLEVITAETDLRTSQINFYIALYQTLASKLDVQRELGQINY